MNSKKFVDTKYGRIAYLDSGKGKETIVYFHGWNLSPSLFSKLETRFAKSKYRVVSNWMPFSGESFIPTKDFSFSDLVEALSDFLDKVQVRKVHLIGHSLGGSAALGLATELKKRIKVKSITVIDSPLKSIDRLEFVKMGVSALVDTASDKTTTIPKNEWDDKKDNFNFKYEFKIANLLKTLKIDFEALNKSKIPVLFLWGRNDLTTPLRENLEEINRIKKSKIEIVPGHHTWHYEKSEEFLDAIETFVRENERNFFQRIFDQLKILWS